MMMDEQFSLSGRVVIITGAANGLGEAIALGMARAGADIAGADINKDGLDRTIAQVEAIGRKGLSVLANVSRPDEVALFFEEVDRAFGRVDILVNNAGIPSHALPEDVTLEEWNRILSINLTGYFLCAQEAGRRMIQQGQGGSIINLSSIAGSLSLGRGNFVFGVSKGAVNQLTRELAVEWAKHKIRVNAILPCQIHTPALKSVIDDPRFDSQSLIERFLMGIPFNRLGEPADVVGPAIFLASDAAGFVTGVLLPVDGGNSALNAGGSHRW